MTQAAQIVFTEISPRTQGRAFSEFSAEPSREINRSRHQQSSAGRISFLQPGHSEIQYQIDADVALPRAVADEDRVKGIFNEPA